MTSRAVLAVTIILVVLSVVPGAQADEVFTYIGTTVNGPQFNRPGATAPFAPSGTIVSYQVQPFQVNQTTTCFVHSTQNGTFDGFLHVYQGTFNPLAPQTGVIRGNDDDPILGIGSSQVTSFPATAGTPYFVVTSAFDVQTNGDFQNDIFCDSAGLPNRLVITHGNCTNVQNNTRACLNNDRFQVSATFRAPGGSTTNAQVVAFGSGESALFWFFGPQNFELLVKVLNFCSGFNTYTMFAAGTTDVEVNLTVIDQLRGGIATINNPLGSAFQNRAVTIPNSCP